MQILRTNYAKTLTRQVFGETLKINCKEPHEAALCRIVIAMPGERNERNVLRMSSLTLLWNTEVPQSMKWELTEHCNHQCRHPSLPVAREELDITDRRKLQAWKNALTYTRARSVPERVWKIEFSQLHNTPSKTNGTCCILDFALEWWSSPLFSHLQQVWIKWNGFPIKTCK